MSENVFPTLTGMVVEPVTQKPVKERYGIWCVECPTCKWKNISRRKPTHCEACSNDVLPVETDFNDGPHDVACFTVTKCDLIINRLYEIAKANGYYVVKISERRFMVLRDERGVATVSYGDGQQRAYQTMEEVCKGTWQEVMKFIRDKTPDLPDYLKRKL